MIAALMASVTACTFDREVEKFIFISMLNCAAKIQKSFEMQEHVINIPKKAHP
jgi:hypothetical protein